VGARALLGWIVLAAAGCDDLSRFATDGDTVLRGSVVGGEEESFIRVGFAPDTAMELDFDPRASDRPFPGTITTSPDPVTGARAFEGSPLIAIAPLQHDLLSEYEFPGGDRVRNYLYVVRPGAGPLAGRDVMVFLSLMDDGGAEVRVVAGAGDAARGDHFGVFRLRPGARE
jgi:hypothetical protein